MKKITIQDAQNLQKTKPNTIIGKRLKHGVKIHYAKCGHLIKDSDRFMNTGYALVEDISKYKELWCKFCRPTKSSS